MPHVYATRFNSDTETFELVQTEALVGTAAESEFFRVTIPHDFRKLYFDSREAYMQYRQLSRLPNGIVSDIDYEQGYRPGYPWDFSRIFSWADELDYNP